MMLMLSRDCQEILPCDEPDDDSFEECTVARSVVAAVCNMVDQRPFVESVCASAKVLSTIDEPCELIDKSCSDWRKAQRADPCIGPLMDCVTRRATPDPEKFERNPEVMKLIPEFDKMKMKRGVMYRVILVDGEEKS